MISQIGVINVHYIRKIYSGPLYRPMQYSALTESIMNMINEHFYYFGSDKEHLIMPIGSFDDSLLYKGGAI